MQSAPLANARILGELNPKFCGEFLGDLQIGNAAIDQPHKAILHDRRPDYTVGVHRRFFLVRMENALSSTVIPAASHIMVIRT